MTQIRIAEEVREDFDRIIDHLLEHDVAEPAQRIDAILSAIDALALNPMIGRPAHDTLRELVIGQGKQGYVALYRHSEILDQVMIVALRAQQEAGYRHP
jgi:toxin ParE1/3/4